MNAQMGSALPIEKLDRHNYASWKYKMYQYLVGQGYWSYLEGAQEKAPDLINPNYPTWQQGASRVIYCLAKCVQDHMLSYIRDVKAPKEAWKNLKKIFVSSTTTRKLQLRQELNNIRQRDMSGRTIPSKSKTYVIHSAPSMSQLMMMRWCISALVALHKSMAHFGLP